MIFMNGWCDRCGKWEELFPGRFGPACATCNRMDTFVSEKDKDFLAEQQRVQDAHDFLRGGTRSPSQILAESYTAPGDEAPDRPTPGRQGPRRAREIDRQAAQGPTPARRAS